MKKEIKRRRFGKTDLEVTELSFGAMNLRLLETKEQAREILDFVLQEGINFIDTARAYNGENGSGQHVESEVLVGEALKRNQLKEPIVIISKHHGYEIPELKKDLETSRNKLDIKGKGNLKIGDNDIEFVYLFHGINQERWETMKKSGALEKAQELKEEGLINHIGFSSHYPHKEVIEEALRSDIFDVTELPYNVFNRSLGEDGEIDLLKLAFDRDVGIINMKAFSGNGMVPIMNVLQEITNIGYDSMLNFCLTNPYISTVDAGAKYVEEFKQDIEVALLERLTVDEKSDLKTAADRVAPHMRDICRECMHCMEKFSCPQEIDFPGILGTFSRYLISEKLGKDTAKYKEQYQEFERTVEECIECGECLPWCEYDLEVPDMLQEAQQKLGN